MIMNLILSALVVIVLGLMVMVSNWRVHLALFGLLYLLAAGFMIEFWETAFVVVFLMSGWLSISILVSAQTNSETVLQDEEIRRPMNRYFRVLAILPFVLMSVALASAVIEIFPAFSLFPTMIFLFLFSFSIMMAGFSIQPIRYIVAILLFFMGFFVLYATFDASLFVIGILAFTQLSLALIGAYLIMVGDLEKEGETG